MKVKCIAKERNNPNKQEKKEFSKSICRERLKIQKQSKNS
jgi:hypothetical protein